MSERDTRIGELYEAALKRPIGERAAFVASRAGGDGDLRRRVEALLKGQHDTELPGYEAGTGADTLLAAGTQIGTYRIDGPLGAGGMGVVYRATDTKLQRPAAIKVLPENLADPEARRRFQREAQMVSSLNHPHIVTVYDAGEYLERQYLITEYVDGGTLRQWAGRPHGWRPIVELLIGVADGIATAHDAGILHRDIKPENILLAKNGYAKLADFGIAKLLEADPLADDVLAAIRPGGESSLIGTAAYMSPEQAQGLALDARSDVYSFGLVLHELLAGTRSFGHGEPGKSASALPPLGAEVPSELRTIVAKALEPEPADRYQTMRDLVVDLRRLVRTGVVAPPQRFADRRLWYLAAGLVLLAALGLATRETFLGGRSAKAVAVLPFVNESDSADDLAIIEGLGDDLRERLMALPGLSVQARASSISFRDQDVDMTTIASRLGVGRLVNASVRRTAQTLEVVVEVLDDRGFAIRPPLRFQGPETGLLAMQQDIAMQVSRLLVPEAESATIETPRTPTVESESANMLVMAGSRYEHQVKDELSVDVAKLDLAIGYYRRAIAADPKSVAARSRLAGALIYKGGVDDVAAAQAPLLRAFELTDSVNASTSSVELSDLWYTAGLYRLRTRAGGAVEAYERALALNPNNVDALGAYAQWLMTNHRGLEADEYFKKAIDRDRQSLSRYVDYAEYLGTIEDMERVREVGREILSRFPNDARAYLKLARLYELTGELDVGIAWGLKAFELQPDNPDTRGQVAELFARIGDFEAAAQYEPEPRIGLLYLQQRYEELTTLAEEAVYIDRTEDVGVWHLLAFAYNATGDPATAKSLLEKLGYPEAGRNEAFATYVDALQALGGNDALVQKLAEYRIADSREVINGGMEKSWWVNVYLACAHAQLDQTADALDALERVKNAQGLVWSPLMEDALCFKRLAGEPRYRALLDHLEERKKVLRERLPATLLEYGVADVRPAGTV